MKKYNTKFMLFNLWILFSIVFLIFLIFKNEHKSTLSEVKASL